MIRYQLINTYTAQRGETCDRCGKAIKNVYMVKDNALDKYIYVGSTCIDKVLYVENDTVKNAIIRKVEHFRKSVEEIEEQLKISLDDIYFERIKEGSWKTAYNCDKQRTGGYTRYEVYHNIISNRWFNIHQIIKEAKELNKINEQINFDTAKYENIVAELKTILDNKEALPNETEKELAEAERLERIALKEAEEKAEAEKEKENFIDVEGSKINLENVTYTGVEVESGYYGDTYLYEFKKDNFKMIWRTTKELELKENDMINIKGTIKSNRKTDEGNYSYLTRCKIL